MICMVPDLINFFISENRDKIAISYIMIQSIRPIPESMLWNFNKSQNMKHNDSLVVVLFCNTILMVCQLFFFPFLFPFFANQTTLVHSSINLRFFRLCFYIYINITHPHTHTWILGLRQFGSMERAFFAGEWNRSKGKMLGKFQKFSLLSEIATITDWQYMRVCASDDE